MKKIGLTLFIIFFFLSILAYVRREDIIYSLFLSPRQSSIPQPQSVETPVPTAEDIEILAKNLNIPWDIAFLPSGDMLVPERSGAVLKIGSQTKVITKIAGVKHVGEGGLLGLVLHPKFSQNHFVYLYSTTQDSRGITNRVERYTFINESLRDKRLILEGIKGSSNHDGGRMKFSPDGYLYITTGDAENSALAQNKSSLNGKILRIFDDGNIPPDNPFGNAVYSLGHRNPQGLTWDDRGNLWESEHGPSGSQTGYDEINIIQKGNNYGWPIIKGDEKRDGYISPVIQSGSKDTWAPADLAYLDGNLFFSGLRGEAIYKAHIDTDLSLKLSTYYKREFGRVRAMVLGPDGFLYITTSNTDGRGKQKEGDDKIIKINPRSFK